MPWRHYFTHNILLKLLSLALAVLVYLTFHSGDRFKFSALKLTKPTPGVKTLVGHKIAVIKDASDARAISIHPDRVDIQLTATDARSFDQLDLEVTVEAFVDFREVRNDAKTARVQIIVPDDMRVDRVTPREVTLDLLNP